MRTSDLPALNGVYDVPAAAAEQFRRDGHTVLRALASPEEIAAWRPVIHEVALAHNTQTRALEERNTYGKAFLQITNLWQKDDTVRPFVLSPRFARVAADIMGVDGVRLYHDQALFKEARGGMTPWHQDQVYWPLATQNTITMWMPLVEVPAEVGSMTFAAGSHRDGGLGQYGISSKSEAVFEELVKERGYRLATHGALAAGDATFHNGLVLHRAPPNPTGVLRAVMTVIYFEDGVRVAEPDSPFQEHDMKTWLPGCSPGDAAASEINPVLYSR